MIHDPLSVKAKLYEMALSPDSQRELALAAGQFGADDSNFADFLDFFALEWVDDRGYTLIERAFGSPPPPELLPWILALRQGVFVVDDWRDGVAELRDAQTEAPLKARVADPLPVRSVIVGRLLPSPDGVFQPSGEPDVYDPMSMMARLDLQEGWRRGPRAALSARLAELRAAFIMQREHQLAFVLHFGTDELLFDGPEDLREAMRGFIAHMLTEDRPASLGGLTHAELRVRAEGLSVPQLVVEVGQNLRGPVGVIYDRDEGLHFLPGYARFKQSMSNGGEDIEIIRLYASEPGITRLPFQRAANAVRLAAALGLKPAPLDALLDQIKPPTRTAPSLLPGFEVGRAENATLLRGFGN